MNELALFAGAGGGILAGRLLGWRCRVAVELDAYARDVLIARQNDGSLEPFPIWDDICTFDGREWEGVVDVVSGGFPCQDISVAGKGGGIQGERSGLWTEMARIIGEVRPRFAFVENVPALTFRGRGLGTVLGDLAAMGFNAEWGVLGAGEYCSAPHKRDRIWIVAAHAERDSIRDAEQWEARRRVNLQDGGRAEPSDDGAEEPLADASRRRRDQQEKGKAELPRRTKIIGSGFTMADADRAGRAEQRWPVANEAQHKATQRGGWWESEPDVGLLAHELAPWLDRNGGFTS